MAISSSGLEVQMHLFDRTIFMPPQVDEILLPPIHVVLALKEKNAGKLDSHAGFLETFAEHLKRKYRILIEVGTVPTETAIVGVRGELTTYRPNFCQVTVAVQHFEYTISNILYRSTASAFSFINMHMSEDRILCFEIVARLNERRTMHYCKGAVAKADVPKTIEDLIRQRRRWLNGTFFAAVYAVMHFPRVVNGTVHSAVRKFFSWEFVFIATVLTVTWMFLSNLYLTFHFIRKGGFRNTFGNSGDEKGAEDALLFMSLIYLSFLMVQFVIGLGNRPENMSPARRHGAMLLLVVISLPGIDAVTSLWPEPRPREERVLSAYTPLTDSNIRTAAQLWVSNQASATTTYGLVHTWDLSQVTNLATVWCGYDATNCGSAYFVPMRYFNGDISMWNVSKVTSMYRSKSTRIFESDLS
jgi:cellulose synthase/poly-beta-1,6-N-acetylglucosamine synthase-like glycosyltransferase